MKSLVPAGALAFALVALSTGCSIDTVSSKDVNANAIHQDYDLTYDEASNTTSLSAQFRVGGATGTTIELEDPSSLKINGQIPGKSSILGTRYELDQAGYVPNASFEYTDDSGRSLVNAIAIAPVSLSHVATTVTVSTGYSVDVQAPALAGNESVVAELSQDGSDGNFVAAVGTFDSVHSRVVFSPSDLSELASGTAILQIRREKQSTLVQATSEGGMISASYVLRPIQVSVIGNAPVSPLAKN